MSKLAWAFLITDGSGDDPTPPVELEEETIAYLTAGDEELDTPFAEAVNDYVLALKAANAWDTDDLHYIFCAPTKTQAKVNLMNPGVGDLTEVGTIGITPYQGVTTPSTSDYLEIDDVENYLVHRTATSASFGIHIFDTLGEIGGMSLDMSSESNEVSASKYLTSDAFYFTLSGSTVTYGVSVDEGEIDDKGYFVATLNDVEDNAIGYQNGSALTDIGGTRTQVALQGWLRLLGGHISAYKCERTISTFHLGGHLTSGQIIARTAAIEQLLTDLQEI